MSAKTLRQGKHMLLELEAGLRATHESAAGILLEAFEELLLRHRLKVPALPPTD